MKETKHAAPVTAVSSRHVLPLVQAAMIAAVYVVLTYLANALGLANYAIQVRFSEALTILPYFLLPLPYPVCSSDVCYPTF